MNEWFSINLVSAIDEYPIDEIPMDEILIDKIAIDKIKHGDFCKYFSRLNVFFLSSISNLTYIMALFEKHFLHYFFALLNIEKENY